MHQLQALSGWVQAKVSHYFPERKIYFGMSEDVRPIVIGTRPQLLAAGAAALVASWLAVGTINTVDVISTDLEIAAKQAELARMESQVAAMQADVTSLKGNVAKTAARIENRQAFLAALLSGKGSLDQLVEMMPKVELASAEADVDAHASVLEPFRKIESQQLAFVDKATVAAEARYRDTKALIQRLGLDHRRFIMQTSIALGGPQIDADSNGAPLERAEPRFKELFLSWKKLDQLAKAMVSVPSFKPVKAYTYTSGFGVRYDPFTGSTAMHTGIDMAGPVGEEIYAAADGKVEKAAYVGAYGNMVEIAHGKGINTRYGHMSALLVRAGDTVKKGELIGRMGSTGRSTGSHLHYEVRIDGRAVNPMPFLEASEAVAAVQDNAEEGKGGPNSSS